MVKKLKAVFISLSLLSGFVVADINDDIQRKQAQDRRELELNCQVSPRYSLLSKTTLRKISGFLINKSGFKLYQYSKAS